MRRTLDGGRRGGDVLIVSTNPETLDGLQTYLRGAGVAARCTSNLGDCAKPASATTAAFVLFPDDFRWEKVIATLADLAEHHPKAVPVLVTSQPQRFSNLGETEKILIVPRPAWGWTILDAVRAHLDTQSSRQSDRGRRR